MKIGLEKEREIEKGKLWRRVIGKIESSAGRCEDIVKTATNK
jgi:hypothetical protein